MGIKVTAQAGSSKLAPGQYVASIDGAPQLVNTESGKHPWSDTTNQLKIVLVIDGTKIDHYQSLKGFKYEGDDLTDECKNVSQARLKAMGVTSADWKKKSIDDQINMLFTFEQADEYGDADKAYAVYAHGDKCRVENPEKTKACMDILGRLGVFTGLVDAGEEFDTDDLDGQDIGVEIKHFTHKSGKTYMKVEKLMSPEAVTA
jgi:hypothetical protein